ncbi:hypothetical protein ACHAQJ_004541 [Trichoderma viride]
MDSDQDLPTEHNPKATSPLVDEVSDSPAQTLLHGKHEMISPGQQKQGTQWSPGMLKQFPYRGVLALIGCVLCIAASVVILMTSDGQPVTDWSISPAVYLAFLTTVLNALARFAFSEGYKISWWSAAIRGTTVSHLHRYWAGGDSVLSVVLPGRGFGIVSLAKLATTLIAIDQPLIQRASSIVPRQLTTSVTVTAPIAPEIPYGYTANQWSPAVLVSSISMKLPMLSAFGGYNSKSPITHNFTGCADTCTGIVRASGFKTNCSTSTYEFNPWSFLEHASDAAAEPTSPFNVSWNINLDRTNTIPAYITSLAYYAHDTAPFPYTTCTSSMMTLRYCHLHSATLEYPVQLQGNNLTFTGAIDNLTVVSVQPPVNYYSGADKLDFGWTTVGFVIAATILFNSTARYTFGGIGGGSQLNLPDVTSSQFVDITAANYPGCATWADPTPYMLSAMNEMAFRLSLEASNATY